MVIHSTQPTHADIETLLKTLVLPFYHVKREMRLPMGERRLENDAEHSWSLAFLACSLAPQVDVTLDIGKLCQFAIAHDLVEVYADDTPVFGDTEALLSKEEREEKALEAIAKESTPFPWIIQTITEYERKDSNEAKFIYALDKYIATAYDYIDEGRLFRQRKMTLVEYNKTLESHRIKAHSHQAVGKYYDEVRSLLDSHPEYFHQ
jgi:5'-deoxynucleotidase YfbR-like HD superfamily hydrolase